MEIAWDSLDCGPKIVAWQWVTNGCHGNQGFYFRANAENQLVSGLTDETSGKKQCVVAPAETAGTQLELAPCTGDPSTAFSYERSTGLIHHANKCVRVGQPGPPPSTTNVWSRKLSGGKVAIVFLNVGATVAPNVTCDAACIVKTGLAGKAVTVRDLWLKKDISTEESLSELTATNLPAEGGHLMLLLTPK